jgi:hypothetical protein
MCIRIYQQVSATRFVVKHPICNIFNLVRMEVSDGIVQDSSSNLGLEQEFKMRAVEYYDLSPNNVVLSQLDEAR